MKISALKVAMLVMVVTPSAAYANAFAAGEGSINWGTGRFAARNTLYLCDPAFGPAWLFIPCGVSGRLPPLG